MKKRVCGVIAQHFWELPPPSPPDSASPPTQDRLRVQLEKLIEEEQIGQFAISMEQGLPLDLANTVLKLREAYDLRLECVIPFEEQHIDWSDAERERYFDLIAQCDKEQLLQGSFSLLCYQNTLKYLLSCCDCFLIIWNGQPSDAGDAVRLIRRKALPLWLFDPLHLQD